MRPVFSLVVFTVLMLPLAASGHPHGHSPKAAHAQALAQSDLGGAKAGLAGAGIDWCRTHQKFLERYPSHPKDASCFEGTCDNPINRDASIPNSGTPIKTINLIYHVFRESDGSNPAATQSDVDLQTDELNAAFAPSRIQFNYTVNFINNSTYRNFLDSSEAAMKNTYAQQPDEKLNIYVVNILASYLGVGTFPWDPVALQNLGGIIMHEAAFGPGQKTLTHEVGHCLGLWHTHHGVTEVPACSACYERANGFDADRTGDFCGDTAPTPINFLCSDPNGTDSCSSTPWGNTDTQNYMGYAPDSCYSEFSPQQKGRMHCWSNAVLDSWIEEPGEGRVKLDRALYNCADTIEVALTDEDLIGDGTATVTLDSTGGDSELMVLTEVAETPGLFVSTIGTVNASPSTGNGTLEVSGGDTLTVTYNDASNAQNQPAIATDVADSDCVPPVISNVEVEFLGGTLAVISFDTSEPCTSSVFFGSTCIGATSEASGSVATNHSILLPNLESEALYRYKVRVNDTANNEVEDDASGSCYSFTTLAFFDYLTESFNENPDLDFLSLTFTPSPSLSGYRVCTEVVSALPTPTAGSLPVTLGDDDFQSYSLTGGQTVTLHGEVYSSLFINSNGNITFDAGDIGYAATVGAHLSTPRISALFADLDPSSMGTVHLSQTSDRVAITYLNVPEWGMSSGNTMQVELFFDGTIRITYLGLGATYGVSGLSAGLGAVAISELSDFSAYVDCSEFGPLIVPYIEGTIWSEVGGSAEMRVVYSGLEGTPAFSWRKNEVPLGVTTVTLTLDPVSLFDEGYYRAVVTDESKANYVTPSFFLQVLPENGLPVAGTAALSALVALLGAGLFRRRRA